MKVKARFQTHIADFVDGGRAVGLYPRQHYALPVILKPQIQIVIAVKGKEEILQKIKGRFLRQNAIFNVRAVKRINPLVEAPDRVVIAPRAPDAEMQNSERLHRLKRRLRAVSNGAAHFLRLLLLPVRFHAFAVAIGKFFNGCNGSQGAPDKFAVCLLPVKKPFLSSLKALRQNACVIPCKIAYLPPVLMNMMAFLYFFKFSGDVNLREAFQRAHALNLRIFQENGRFKLQKQFQPARYSFHIGARGIADFRHDVTQFVRRQIAPVFLLPFFF